MYELNEKELSILSYPIAIIFIGELKLEDYPSLIFKKLNRSEQIIYGISFEINQRIFARFPDFFKNSQDLSEEWFRKKANPSMTEDEAWKKVLELEPWILEEEKEKAEKRRKAEEEIRKQQAQLEKLPINVALEKYPELGEQLITSNHIKLKMFPEPIRPSIKNWLADYTFTIGISNHDPIIRGDYLFKGDNAASLSAQDREKLTDIIKSFEEKIPLTINTKTKQVVFIAPERKEAPRTPIRPAVNQNIARRDLEPTEIRRGQESYPQKEILPQLQKRFQSDEERISAWRKDLPEKRLQTDESRNENIRFSSPQTFSTEKPPETPRPAAPNYPAQKPVARINYATPRPMPRNVVNLREE
ncbi:MAG: hypothetical protein WCO05_02215 [Candidatus Moraniibacteriota bacterium]